LLIILYGVNLQVPSQTNELERGQAPGHDQ